MKQPIIITGTERSGATMIAEIIHQCGVWKGDTDEMMHNKGVRLLEKQILITDFPETEKINIPTDWQITVQDILTLQGYTDGSWMHKSNRASLLYPVWDYAFPSAKWVIVRRRTGDIVQSCIKTGYMKYFKNPENLKRHAFTTEQEGWVWWVRQYEQHWVNMIHAGMNCKVLWPERMVRGDYEQLYETIEWLGLQWNSKILEFIDPKFKKAR